MASGNRRGPRHLLVDAAVRHPAKGRRRPSPRSTPEGRARWVRIVVPGASWGAWVEPPDSAIKVTSEVSEAVSRPAPTGLGRNHRFEPPQPQPWWSGGNNPS